MSKDYSDDTNNSKEEKIDEKKKFGVFHSLFVKEKNEGGNIKKNLIQRIGIGNLFLLLICGIVFVYLCYMKDPVKKTEEKQDNKTTSTQSNSLDANPIYTQTNTESEDYVKKIEEELKAKLSLVKGIGKVEVMITLAESKELVTLKDAPYTDDSMNESDGKGGNRVSDTVTRGDETVMSTTEDGEVAPYIIKEIQPTILGVLIIAQGGGDVELQVEIIEAVEALFDVPVHKIKVMEME